MRSLCYVDDLIEGCVRLRNIYDGLTGPVNPGNPGGFSMSELAQKVKALIGSRPDLIHEPLPSDAPIQRQPNIHIAREAMGWEPTMTLEERLKPTIGYFERLLLSER